MANQSARGRGGCVNPLFSSDRLRPAHAGPGTHSVVSPWMSPVQVTVNLLATLRCESEKQSCHASRGSPENRLMPKRRSCGESPSRRNRLSAAAGFPGGLQRNVPPTAPTYEPCIRHPCAPAHLVCSVRHQRVFRCDACPSGACPVRRARDDGRRPGKTRGGGAPPQRL